MIEFSLWCTSATSFFGYSPMRFTDGMKNIGNHPSQRNSKHWKSSATMTRTSSSTQRSNGVCSSIHMKHVFKQ